MSLVVFLPSNAACLRSQEARDFRSSCQQHPSPHGRPKKKQKYWEPTFSQLCNPAGTLSDARLAGTLGRQWQKKGFKCHGKTTSGRQLGDIWKAIERFLGDHIWETTGSCGRQVEDNWETTSGTNWDTIGRQSEAQICKTTGGN